MNKSKTNKKGKAAKPNQNKKAATVVVKVSNPPKAKKSKEKLYHTSGIGHRAIESRIQTVTDADIAEYAKCLIFPYDNATRVPTAFNNKSALVKTRRTFTIKCPSRNGQVVPKFAFFVQPKIGSPTSPFSYQIGLVDFSVTDTPSLVDPASYIAVDNGGESFALDPNAPWITQSKPKAYGLTVPTPTFARPLNGIVDTQYTVQGVPNQTMTYGPKSYVVPGLTGNDILRIPAGSYLLTLKTTTAAASIAVPVQVSVVRANSEDANVGYATRITTAEASHTVQNNTFAVLLTELDGINFAWANGITDATKASSMEIVITPLCSPKLAWSSNYGLTESVRPVGCSVLTTCVLSNLYKGGIIRADLFPSESKDKLLEGNWLLEGQFSGKRDVYTGNLAYGNYIWWRPDNLQCVEFKSVDEANETEYPIMVITGDVPAGITDKTAVCNVTVEFVYEILNNTQLLESKKVSGSTAAYEAGLRAVQNVPVHTENPEHSSLLKDIGGIMHEGAKFLPLLSFLM